MNRKIVVSAPGKVILHGEHAVVFGKKAIACAVNGTVTVDICGTADNCITIHLPLNPTLIKDTSPVHLSTESLKELFQIALKCGEIEENLLGWQSIIKKFVASTLCLNEKEDNMFILSISSCIFGYLKILVVEGSLSFPPVSLKIRNENLPIGAGLGSSAAFNVSLSTSMLLYAHLIVPLQDASNKFVLDDASLRIVNKNAFVMETLMHGNASGIDNTVSTFGGVVVYENGESNRLTGIPSLQLLIVDAGVSRNTKALVSQVKEKTLQFPCEMSDTFQAIHEVATEAENIFKLMENCKQEESDKYHKKLQELVRRNQQLLQVVGVSHPKIEEICQVAEEYNFSCKLTGAGGGGCAIILLDKSFPCEHILHLKNKLNERKFKNWHAKLGCEGVAILEISDEILAGNTTK